MAGSAIAILLMARKPKGVPQYMIHAFVVIWSGLAARRPRAGYRRGAVDPTL